MENNQNIDIYSILTKEYAKGKLFYIYFRTIY